MSAGMPGPGASAADYVARLDARIEDALEHGGLPLTTAELEGA